MYAEWLNGALRIVPETEDDGVILMGMMATLKALRVADEVPIYPLRLVDEGEKE